MLRKLLVALIALTATLPAAFELQSVSTTGVAIGSVSSLYPGGLNPAVLIPQQTTLVHADYTCLFGISGLDYYQLDLNRGFRRGTTAGLSMQNLGNKMYQEKTVGLKVGRDIRKVFSVGITLNLYNIAITGYESASAAGLTLGSLWNLNPETQLSFVYQNVNSPSIYHDSDPLPECFVMGGRYVVNNRVEICGELFKDTRFPFTVRLGSVIRPFDFLELKCGSQFNPDRYSAGLSVCWRKFTLDFAVQHHEVLPYTLYYGIGYGIK